MNRIYNIVTSVISILAILIMIAIIIVTGSMITELSFTTISTFIDITSHIMALQLLIILLFTFIMYLHGAIKSKVSIVKKVIAFVVVGLMTLVYASFAIFFIEISVSKLFVYIVVPLYIILIFAVYIICLTEDTVQKKIKKVIAVALLTIITNSTFIAVNTVLLNNTSFSLLELKKFFWAVIKLYLYVGIINTILIMWLNTLITKGFNTKKLTENKASKQITKKVAVNPATINNAASISNNTLELNEKVNRRSLMKSARQRMEIKNEKVYYKLKKIKKTKRI